MSWQQPVALAGLLALAIPVLIHLLGRGRAKQLRFPTLRFVEQSRLLPTRRTRLHDRLLLCVRMAIVGAAALALAQPLWTTARRTQSFRSSIARVVIVDTSASVRMSLPGVTGKSLVDSALPRVERIAPLATQSVVLQTASPSSALPGALSWLAMQKQRSEVVVISDFQIGAINERMIQTIPSFVGVRLVRMGGAGGGRIDRIGSDASYGTRVVHANTALTEARNSTVGATREFGWTESERRFVADEEPVQILADDRSLQPARAAFEAAVSISQNAVRASNDTSPVRVVIVAPNASQRSSLATSTSSRMSPRTVAVLAAIDSDAEWREQAFASVVSARDSAVGIPLGRTQSGQTVAYAAESIVGGRTTLAILLQVDPGSLASAALLAAARRAVSGSRSASELEPRVWSDLELQRWSREPSESANVTWPASLSTNFTTGEDPLRGESDARWLWMLVVVLLIGESFLRRHKPPTVQQPA